MSENDKYTREDDKRFTLRINKELFKKLEESARKHKRAIGREIEYLLEMELGTDKPFVTKEDVLDSFKFYIEEFGLSEKDRNKYLGILKNPDKYDFSTIVARPDL